MDTGMMVFCVKTARWSCRERVEKAQWRSRKENDGVFLCQNERKPEVTACLDLFSMTLPYRISIAVLYSLKVIYMYLNYNILE